MIDLSPVLSVPTPPAAPAAATPGSAAGMPPNTFGQTLGAFLDANDAAAGQAAVGERQGIADDGKDLPEGAAQGDNRPQEADSGATPAWFPAFMLPTPPVPAPVETMATALPDTSAVAPEISAMPFPAAAPLPVPPPTHVPPPTPLPLVAETATDPNAPTPTAALEPRATTTPMSAPSTVRVIQHAPAPGESRASVSVDSSVPVGPAPLAVASASPAESPPVAAVAGQTAASAVATPPRPIADLARAAVADAPSAAAMPVALARADPAAQAIAVSTTPQPAGQVFAAAIATATSWRARGTAVGERDRTDVASPFAAVGPTTVSDRAIVQATGDVQNATLDLSRDSGLQGMIDRIETLRDGADAADTRVRLTPDALGSVDIAVRQEGDRVHVHFTAEQEATRTLIADAQPRLSELAAARGVRIGETSVGTGTGGSTPQQSQTQPSPRFARAPASVATDTDSTITDHRLA